MTSDYFNMQDIIKIATPILSILAIVGIEISPIKINPIKLVGRVFRYMLGLSTLDAKIDSVQNNVSELRSEVDKNERDRIRYEILQFSGSLRNGLERTENDYNHIEEIYEKYTNKGWNSYISSEMYFIRECRNNRKKVDNK